MKQIFNKMVSLYLDRRYHQIEYFMNHPHEVQERVFGGLLSQGKLTEYGERNHFKEIKNQVDFANRVPLTTYEDLKEDISRMMHGEKSVLWPGQIKWFSKSSGTTNDKSKFIPVSSTNLRFNHIKGSWDVVTLLYHNDPNSQVFAEKNLVMGGSVSPFDPYPTTRFGDISGIMVENMPAVGRPFYTPDFETALLQNWDEKIERMVRICSEENVTMFGGVPTWTIVLFRKILEYTGKRNILEVWPEVQTYVHGGVAFGPYKEQFKQFLPTDDFNYIEVYNASEGYFAIQNDLSDEGMLLLLDNGIYYEFISMADFGSDREHAVPLAGVKLGVNYAMVITTNSGLWRYLPGDTIEFVSLDPYRIKITGRTKHFINVFGEEVMVSNTDTALTKTCQEFNVQVVEYTVGPVFMEGEDGKGGHEWAIEFIKPPEDHENFAKRLDENIQKVNSDYEAKRYKDMALVSLKLNVLESGTFQKWLESKGKWGGQNKVPRLSNDRLYLQQLLNI